MPATGSKRWATTRSATATSFDLAGPLPAGFALTVNVRLYDLAKDAGPFDAGNVLRASRACVNYSVPVPEPTTALMLLAGLGLLLAFRRSTSATPSERPPRQTARHLPT